jgi:hypothetical protein
MARSFAGSPICLELKIIRLRMHAQFPVLGFEIMVAWFHSEMVWFADSGLRPNGKSCWRVSTEVK